MVNENSKILAERWATEHGYPNNTDMSAQFAELIEIGRKAENIKVKSLEKLINESVEILIGKNRYIARYREENDA